MADDELNNKSQHVKPIPRGFLPLFWAWAFSPFLSLLVLEFAIEHLGPTFAMTFLRGFAFISSPIVIYSWAAWYVRRRRIPYWAVNAVPLALVFLVLNLVLFVRT